MSINYRFQLYSRSYDHFPLNSELIYGCGAHVNRHLFLIDCFYYRRRRKMFICECVFSARNDSDVLIDMDETVPLGLFLNELWRKAKKDKFFLVCILAFVCLCFENFLHLLSILLSNCSNKRRSMLFISSRVINKRSIKVLLSVRVGNSTKKIFLCEAISFMWNIFRVVLFISQCPKVGSCKM